MPRLKSILRGTNPEVFAELLTYYVPAPALILDCTSGYKHFWENVAVGYENLLKLLPIEVNETLFGPKERKPLPFEGYQVVYADRRRIADIQADYRYMPFQPRTFNAVIFDPPYVPITLKVSGVKNWIDNGKKGSGQTDRYTTDDPDITENHLKYWAEEAFSVLEMGGIALVKLQDTANNWTYKMYNQRYKFDLEATYIHDLGQNWAENVEVKNARKPIPMHAVWMVFVK